MIGGLSRIGWLLLVAALGFVASAARGQPAEGAMGRLELRVSESGARVLVDGKAVGTSPLARAIELPAGDHELAVEKAGHATFSRRVTIAAGSTLELDVVLEPLTEAGRVRVTSAGGEELRVLIDGREVGETPYEGELPAGRHQISGRSPEARVPVVTIEVAAGTLTEVALAPVRLGTLEVLVEGVRGTITVDGVEVATGRYRGDLPEGRHRIRVEAEGYDAFEGEIAIAAGEVHVETVTLRRRAAGTIEGERRDAAWRFDGVYGGLELLGMFVPGGSGHTLQASCEATGATSCAGGIPLGAGLGGYLGYALAPVGLELFLLASGDVVQPSARFDGVSGSAVNPLIATPARDEDFTIGRFGGGGVVRMRILHPIDRFRITGAIGAGAVYKHLLLARDTVSDDGQTSHVEREGTGYLSAALSLELGVQLLVGETTALGLGVHLWVEHAGSDTTTEPQSDTLLIGGDGPPRPQATPAYDMATGTQAFIGPHIGIQFGP